MTETLNRHIEIRFPAQGGYLRISRISATSLAADMGFDVDELDDLRLAVDEAVNWLVRAAGGGDVVLTMDATPRKLVVEGSCSEASGDDESVDDLVHAVLGATVDEYRIGVADGRRVVWLTKSRVE